RRRRPAALRELHGLRAAAQRRHPAPGDRPPRDAVTAEPARPQGRRRVRDITSAGGGGVGGGGCAGRAGCAGGGDAVDAGDVATDGAVRGRGLERASTVATARWSASALSDLPIQEISWTHDRCPTESPEPEKVPVAGDEGIGIRCNGAFQDAVVRFVFSNDAQPLLGIDERGEAADRLRRLARACFGPPKLADEDALDFV